MMFKHKQSGLTLPEITVVLGIVALLVGLTIPAVNMLFNSFESESGAKSMIDAALASARAIAAKEQRYAGIRFQKLYDPNIDPVNAPQYIIFIIQDPAIMAFGFKAVEGIQPIKLPDSIGVMDLTIVPGRNISNPVNPTLPQIRIDDPVNGGNTAIDDDFELLDTTAFSIIFSPSGKLVIHGIRVRNRDDFTATSSQISYDDVFNRISQINAGFGMFLQDDYWPGYSPPTSDFGLGPEPSRNDFYIYETRKFKQAYLAGNPWNGYLVQIAGKPVYINPYSGTIINE